MPLCVTCALLQRAADFTGAFKSYSVASAGERSVIEDTDWICQAPRVYMSICLEPCVTDVHIVKLLGTIESDVLSFSHVSSVKVIILTLTSVHTAFNLNLEPLKVGTSGKEVAKKYPHIVN